MPRIARKPKGSYHHGNLREAILVVADRLVADEGSAALTIRKVSERLGVTHAAIYHHFEDRTALLASVAERALDRIGAALSQTSAETSLERFHDIGVGYLHFALDHPQLYAAMFGPELVPRERFPGLVAARGRLFGYIRDAIVACQRDGLIKEGSPDEHTLFCWSAVHGVAALVAAGQISELDLPTEPRQIGDVVIDRIFLGLIDPAAIMGENKV